MRLAKASVFSCLLAIYLVYSTICDFSIYSLGTIGNLAMILSLCLIGFTIRTHITNNLADAHLFLIGWILVFLFSIIFNGRRPDVSLFLSFLFCLFYLCLNNEIQISVFKKYVWILSVLILLSAVEFVIYSVTGKGFVISSVTRIQPQGDSHFDHLIFNVIMQRLLPRFQGLFKEAGNMGTTCAFMLFATWKIKTMKFPFYVFLICGLLSLSLGYYVFLFFFLITSVKPSIKNIVGLLIISLIITIIMFPFKDTIEHSLFDRINNVDSIEDLDDRTTYTFDLAFSKAIENGELWLGVGINNLPESVSYFGGNAGAKKWIFQYGVIGFIIVFYIYNMIYFRRSEKKLNYKDWVFLLAFWACFYKSVVFTTSYLFVIYSIMPLLNKQAKNENTICDTRISV